MQINNESLALGLQKSAIREIAALAAERKASLGADKVFDFSLGNPSVPAPDSVKAAIISALELPSQELHGYTAAPGKLHVRQKIADSLNRRFNTSHTAQDLYLTCGAAASINITLNALIEPGQAQEVMVMAPFFPEYSVWIEAAGATQILCPTIEGSFQLDLAAIEARLTPNTRALIINSPNNPTGVVYPKDQLEALADLLNHYNAANNTQITLIVDEPYRELSFGAEVAWLPNIYEHSIVCYSYSKSLSLPGERIGWILVPNSDEKNNELMAAVAGSGRKLGFVCAPSLLQEVLASCVDSPVNVEAYAHNRKLLCEGLTNIGFDFVEPQGAFYLWLKSLEADAASFCKRAQDFQLMLVPSDSFGQKGWVRVSFCVSPQMIENSLPAWEQLYKSYSA